jgi:hypothetical protein
MRGVDGHEEQGLALFITAVERFVEMLSDDEKNTFDAWLETHIDDEEIFAHLLQVYPKFGDCFTEEIEKLAAVPVV